MAVIAISAVVGALIVLGSGCLLAHHRARRTLAAGLVGEIAAMLRTIEVQGLSSAIELPRPLFYEANTGRIRILGPRLQRRLVYLFDRLACIPQEMALANDVAETLRLADEVLLALRPIMSPRSKAKHIA